MMRALLLLAVACGSPSRPTTLPPPDPKPAAPDLSKLATQPISELGVSGEILIYSLEEQPVVAIAPDGKTIATGENDRAVHVRNLPDFRELRAIPSPAAGLIAGSVAFGADGALAIGWVPVGDKATPSAAIYGPTGAVVTRFTGKWVYAGQLIWLQDRFVMRGGKPAVWHADGRGPMHELELPFAKQLAVNAAGTHLVARERRPTYHAQWDEHSRSTNEDPGKLYFARLDSPKITKTINFDPAHVAAAGDDFVAANHEWLRRYDREGNELASVALGGRPDALVALGDRVIVGSRTGPLVIYQLSDLTPQRTVPLTGVVALWPIAPDRLLVLDEANRLHVVQLGAN